MFFKVLQRLLYLPFARLTSPRVLSPLSDSLFLSRFAGSGQSYLSPRRGGPFFQN